MNSSEGATAEQARQELDALDALSDRAAIKLYSLLQDYLEQSLRSVATETLLARGGVEAVSQGGTKATLGLLEAKVAPSVHRWAVEALMFLTIMPDIREHLYKEKMSFGSLRSFELPVPLPVAPSLTS